MLRKVLMAVLAVLLVFSGAQVALQQWEQQQARQDYEQARQLAQQSAPPAEEPPPAAPPAAIPEPQPPLAVEPQPGPQPEPKPEPLPQPEPQPQPEPEPLAAGLEDIDLAALRQENPDVVGWISIPDTVLSYPLMQGEDNDYYLSHTWQKAESRLGSLYLDYRNADDLSDFNSILYGHRMRGDDMFGSLKYYEEQAHWEAHPAIYLVLDEGVRRYDIFAAYEIDSSNCHTYRLGLEAVDGQQAYINYCTKQSDLDTGIVPEEDDHILTLSTCTAAGSKSTMRWIVQAVWSPEN